MKVKPDGQTRGLKSCLRYLVHNIAIIIAKQ